MLGIFQYVPIAIVSNSMYPAFSRGDVIIFKKMTDAELEKLPENSIIVYTKENKNIAHRIVKRIEKNGTVLYQTKGDNNNAMDLQLVKTTQIKGVYVFHIKYIGFPSAWIYSYFKN